MSDDPQDHDAPAGDPPTAVGRWRSLLELVGLSGLTIAQPVLSTFGVSPDFFVFREATRGAIVAFALVVAVGPGLAAWSISRAVGLVDRRAAQISHALFLAGFLGIGVLQVTSGAGVSLVLGIPLAIGAGVVLVLLRRRSDGLRSWLSWLAPAPLAFAALFLFVAPVSDLVRSVDVDPAELGAFGSGDPPPVVVMVFDEWPLSSIVRTDGTIDDEVAPNVARLAERATWYRNATTASNMTNFAVPAILTGNMPEPGDRGDASSQPRNLFTLLGGTYDLQVKESLTRLCPQSLCTDGSGDASAGDRAARLADLLGEAGTVLGDRLDPGGDQELVTDGFVEPEAAVQQANEDDGSFNLDELLAPRPERLDDFLDGMAENEDPTVHYVHVLAPHTPHRHTPSGLRYEPDSALRLITAPDGSEDSDLRAAAEWPAQLDRQRLLLEVGYVDDLVGDVIDRLEETGLYDDALVVMTSDHGLAFEPEASARGIGDRKVDREIEADLLWVPMFVKAPGQQVGETSDRDARTIDVVPTVAGLLSIDLPWATDGVDLNDPPAERAPKDFVRIQGSSFALFEVEDPVEVRASVEEVFENGTDHLLDGDGDDRWWRVGPRVDLVGRPVGDVALGSVSASTVRLDRRDAFDDVDLASGEAPLLVAGRVLVDDEPRRRRGQIAILVDDTIAAVVPTYRDGTGPGRFSAVLDPRLFERGDSVVRVADLVEDDGTDVLELLPFS